MAVPGVTLKVCENEMPGTVTVPVVAVLPEMNRKRLPGPDGVPQPLKVQLLSKVTQKSVPMEVWGVVAAAGAALLTASTPSVATVAHIMASAEMIEASRYDKRRPSEGVRPELSMCAFLPPESEKPPRRIRVRQHPLPQWQLQKV